MQIFVGVAIVLISSGILIYIYLFRRRKIEITSKMLNINTKSKMVLTDSDGKSPLIEIFDGENMDVSQSDFENVELSPVLKSKLNKLLPVLHELPSITNYGEKIFSTHYKIVANSNLLQGIKEGKLNWMRANIDGGGYRLNVIEGKHRVIGQGALQPVESNPTAVIGSVFSVLSVVTLLHYLAEINNQLHAIEQKVHEIKEFLENERFGKILGNLRSLIMFHEIITVYDLNEIDVHTYVSQLETIDRDCLQVLEHIKADFKSIPTRIDLIDEPSFLFGKIGDKDGKVNMCLGDANKLFKTYLLVIYVRSITAALRGLLPCDKRIILLRLKDCLKDIDAIDGAINDFNESTMNKIFGIFKINPDFSLYDIRGRQHKLYLNYFQLYETMIKEKTKTFNLVKTIERNYLIKQFELSKPTEVVVEFDKTGKLERVLKPINPCYED